MSVTTCTLVVNGVSYTVDSSTDPTINANTSLNDFIRTKTPHTATKHMCGRGGCGVCTVACTTVDPNTKATTTRPINSCLAKLFSLNGASIVTNEGIGNAKSGYHPIQKKMAELSASQCGYCSSGFAMFLWSYLRENPNATEAEIEASLDGNLCRCTGYRPILDAFKTFAKNGKQPGELPPPELQSACQKANCCQRDANDRAIDIEDAASLIKDDEPALVTARKSAKIPANKQFHVAPKSATAVPADAPPAYHADPESVAATTPSLGATWQDVMTLKELTYWMQHYSNMNVMLTVGATTFGIYPDQQYDVYLNISAVPELSSVTNSSSGLTIGAAVTITDVINAVAAAQGPLPTSTKHFQHVVAHLKRIAGHSIRNRGSIGGNLMLNHEHQSSTDFFPSDAAVVFTGIGATVNVLDVATNQTTSLSMAAFFAANMKGKVLLNIVLPFCSDNTEVFRSYKIALRQVMSHAYVNAAFTISVDPKTNLVTGKPILAFGGIAGTPIRLAQVEAGLVGTNVTSTTAFAGIAAKVQAALQAAIVPGPEVMWVSESYRVQVAVNYLYKMFLFLQPGLNPQFTNAAQEWMLRPVTSAKQTFGPPDATEEPVSMAIPKVDGLTQVSGEAKYTGDIATPFGTVYGALVQATTACAVLSSIVDTPAKGIPGFVKLYTGADIPKGNNTFGVEVPLILPPQATTSYAGQCIGFVVAETQQAADLAARVIGDAVLYGAQTSTPIVSIEDALNANPPSLFPAFENPKPVQSPSGVDIDAALAKCAKTVTDTCDIGSQFHSHTENHAALVAPVEGEYQVDVASQSPTMVQLAVSGVLGVNKSEVVVRTRRAGGGFGAKVTAAKFTAALAAFAARDLNLPVRLNQSYRDPQRGLGARPLYRLVYTIGTDANNKLYAMKMKIYVAVGLNYSDSMFEVQKVIQNISNCYQCPNFYAEPIMVKTDIAPTTSVRGPGWIQSIAFSEMMMNKMAAAVGQTPEAFRAANFVVNGDTTPAGMPLTNTTITTMFSQLQTSADYAARKTAVAAFNAANKFVKRGLSISCCRFSVGWSPQNFNTLVSVYMDGSIAVTQGGCEIGQGLTTKVTQAVAYKFGLKAEDMPTIRVLSTTTRAAPNPQNVTGGSVTSELVVKSVMNACDVINQRLAPFRLLHVPWKDAVLAATGLAVNLMAEGYSDVPSSSEHCKYNSWGVACSEVQVDGLTGQFEVIRSDLLFDCGISMNPDIDVGQVEGGFMMGLGWFTTEKVLWSKKTGEALTAGTWEYKPPFAADIPEVLNVTLLENSTNKSGVLSSKAVGEPGVSLAVSVPQAIEQAVNAVRQEVGNSEQFFATELPLTFDKIAAACGVKASNYVF